MAAARSAAGGWPRLGGDYQHRGQAAGAREGRRPLRFRLQRPRRHGAHGRGLGGGAARAGPDPCFLQELVQRPAMGGHLQRPVRLDLVASGCAAGGGRRHHRQPYRLADQPRCVDSTLEAVADDLLVGDEQPLAHQLPRRPGRPHRVPVCHPSPQRLRGGRRGEVRRRLLAAADRSPGVRSGVLEAAPRVVLG